MIETHSAGEIFDAFKEGMTAETLFVFEDDHLSELARLKEEHRREVEYYRERVCCDPLNKWGHTNDCWKKKEEIDTIRASNEEGDIKLNLALKDVATLRAERDALQLYKEATQGKESARELIIKNLEAEKDELRRALEVVKQNCLNPAHTMTRVGLEETVDACESIAQEALNK